MSRHRSKKHSSSRSSKTKRSRRRRRHYTCRVCCKWVRKRHSRKKEKSHDRNYAANTTLFPFLARNTPQLVQPPPPQPQPPVISFLRGGGDSNSSNSLNSPIHRANQLAKLKRACPNPEFCIDVGNLEEPIEAFFKHFRDLKMVNKGKIRRIGGEKGKNGFVLKLPFEEDNYAAWTVLKCVADPVADNLALEAWTGLRFVNRYVKRFPCFVKTYGLWKINQFETYAKLSNVTNNNADSLFNPRPISLSDALTYIPPDRLPPPAQMCRDAQFFAVMIQHFGRFQSLGDAFKLGGAARIQHADLLCILFQIYFVLTQLQPHFTHYDLHWYNVGLYQPFADPNDYIEMHYHLAGVSDETIVFPCPFIAKILDYGRAFVDISAGDGNPPTTTTDTLFRAVCEEPKCDPQCGTNYGFRAFTGQKAAEHFITPNKWNPSMDLRLANILNNMTKRMHNNIPLFNEKVHIQYHTEHGTPPNPNNGYDVKRQQFNIRNITDLFHHLVDIFKATPGTPLPPFLQSASLVSKLNAQYAFRTKRAVMHVYAAPSTQSYTFEIINQYTQLANHPSITPAKQEALYRAAPQMALPDIATLVEDENEDEDEEASASQSLGYQTPTTTAMDVNEEVDDDENEQQLPTPSPWSRRAPTLPTSSMQKLRTRLFPTSDLITPATKRPRR